MVLALVEPGADLVVAVDDSVFRRWGRKVWAAGWQHDGSSPSANKISYGNCFVTAGIIVKLPFCTRDVCLPALARLHLPGKGAGPAKSLPLDPWMTTQITPLTLHPGDPVLTGS